MDAAALEPELRERLGPGLEPRLAALDAEFGGLLDRGALVLVAADEEGLLPRQAALEAFADEPPLALDVEGLLERLTETRTFRRPDGSTGFVADAEVRGSAGLLRVVLWDEAVRQAQGRQGQRVRLTRLAPRLRSGARELHTTRATEVLPR